MKFFLAIEKQWTNLPTLFLAGIDLRYTTRYPIEMSILNISRPLLAGVLHSFEPDHVTAVSVLAAENAASKKRLSWRVMLRASQWALGHSVTLLLFGGIALIFKSSLHFFVSDISQWAQICIGPIMILLGIQAIKRNKRIDVMMARYQQKTLHLNQNTDHLQPTHVQEKTAGPFNRSFWVGMLHGLAGTGGVLTSALVISASTMQESIMVLVIESIGIIITMGIYSYALISTMSRFLQKNMILFKWMNGIAGIASAALGCYFIYELFL
ncbi:hypothetical protein [Desertivirga brevis]|uniref:hypothetical protein n=1 Tax=Desertivirga brevis TaxID=2810310 RepID=UPI001A96EB9F|nr:hypothetical protein [Pedobacter sp. SYSU D00873]